MRPKIFSFLLVFALVFSANAQQAKRGRAAQPSAAQPSAERLRRHVTYLASDALDGRRTGTGGANQAARYIAAEFARRGLRPGGGEKGARGASAYMQNFPYVAGVDLGKTNAMLFTRRRAVKDGAAVGAGVSTFELRLSEDFMPLGFSSNAYVYTLPLTFVSYGITATDLKYDDYAAADVKDSIALALSGTPDGDNPHGEFARYADVRWKAVAARDHGASALVIIAADEKFADDRLAQLRYDNSAGDAGLPVVVISRQAAADVLGISEVSSLKDLEQRVNSTVAMKREASPPADPVADAINQGLRFEQTRLTLATEIVRREAPASNVIGVLQGSDPKLRNEAIIIGAHYDHLGRGGEGSLAPRSGEVHHGADDNASGVAGLLELARIFSARRARLKRTIVFIAFSGEEEGLLGSNFYVNHPQVTLAQTVAMINMDMIGRLQADKLIIGGVGTATEWRDWIAAANAPGERGAPQKFALTLNEDGYGPSDHSSFYAKQVPVLFFWTGTHEDYHKPSDTADKINYAGEAQIVSLVADIVRTIGQNSQRPTYAVAKSEALGRSMGFRVYLGTIPNYAESNDGLKLDGVRDDSPAAEAGLKAGDVIVKLAGREVRNVYDYTYALGEMKSGQEYEVELMRAGQRLTLKIIPAARK